MHPPTHRSASIHICPTKSASSDNLLPMAHSVDEALFLSKQHPTTSFFQLWQRITSEPHISENHSRSLPGTNYLSDQFFEKKPFLDPSQWSMSKSASPVTDAKVEDIEFNCDLIEPVTPEDPVRYDDLIGPVDSSSKDACSSDRSDTIIPIDMTIIDEPKGEEFDTDTLSRTASSNNIDRHFRRRKRRSSLTRLSTSSDDSPTVTPDIPSTPTDINNNRQQAKSTEVVEHTEPVPLDSLSFNSKPEETPIENIDSSESASPVGRYRARSKTDTSLWFSHSCSVPFIEGLRHRFYRRPSTITEELTADIPVQFYVPTEPAPSPSAVFTPPPSPPSPVSPAATSPTRSTGSLKRTGSLGTTKKMVRFADSVGRELTQVQYIDSMTNGESKGSAFARKNLYGSHLSSTDLKPWSFDVAQSSRFMFDQPKPKRFFCLYRQPNSEHPDIYLHEVWRSQIKLEYADIRVKPSSTSGEQSLQGTLWVTNASYYKHVTVKYTFNHWINTCECEAQYRCHSNDFRNIDQFDFSIDVPSDVDRIDFVLRYCVNGQEHWDNNDGKNYTLQSESASIPQTTISLPHDCDFDEMRFY